MFALFYYFLFIAQILSLPQLVPQQQVQVVQVIPVPQQPLRLFAKLDWSFNGQDATIKDITGRDYYKIDGKFWSIGQQFTIIDSTGNDVLTAKQKIFSWKRKILGQYLNTAGKWVNVDYGRTNFFDFQAFPSYKFSVQGENFVTTGDLFQWKFDIHSQLDGRKVASIDIDGQNLFRFDWPGAQTYVITIDQSRINPAVVIGALNVIKRDADNRRNAVSASSSSASQNSGGNNLRLAAGHGLAPTAQLGLNGFNTWH